MFRETAIAVATGVSALTASLAALTDLVLPMMCVSCRAPRTAPHHGALCETCDVQWADLTAHPLCVTGVPGVPAFAGGRYEGVSADVLTAVKDHGRHDAAGFLADAVRAATQSALHGLPDKVCVVPTPSRPASIRRRGAAVTTMLARAVAAELRRCGIDARCVHALNVDPSMVDQAGLDRNARWRNAAHRCRAVRVRHGVVLVDDVVTSGATLASCAHALRRNHIHVVAAVTSLWCPPT